MKKENLIMRLLLILLLIAIVLLKFSISQSSEDISLLIQTDKEFYYKGDVVNFKAIININNTPLQNTNITFQIMKENSTYFLTGQTDINGTYFSNVTILNSGNYTITVLLNYTENIYQNTTKFEVREPEIILEKNIYFINETIKIIVIDSPRKYFNINISGPMIQSSVFYHEDEISIFNLSIPISGNYTIKINDVSFDIEILPYLGLLPRKVDLDILLNESYLKNEIINLEINGTPNSEFSLNIQNPNNITILDFKSITDDNGYFTYQISFNNTGNYTVILSFSNKTLEKYFNVYELLPDFKISLENRTFILPQNVSVFITSKPQTNFILKVWSIDKSYIFNLSTDEKGEQNFTNVFDPGNYSISLYFDEKELLNDWFEVINQTIKVEEIEIFNRTENSYYYINSSDYQLYLSEDIESENSGIIISRANNIVIDCLDKLIDAKKYGIIVEYSSNIEIKNCNIQKSTIGIFFKDSNNIKILNNTITRNTQGIIIFNSSNIDLYNNIAIDNEYYGVLLYLSFNYSTINNLITSRSDISIFDILKQEK